MSDTKRFTPKKPIVFQEKTYSSFQIPDEVLTEHLFALDSVKGEAKKGAALLASILDVPLPVIGKLPILEFKRLERVMKPLMDEMHEMADVGNAQVEVQNNPVSD